MIYDSDYTVRLATLRELGGDVTKKYDSTYEIDLEILNIIQGGGVSDLVIDDTSVSSNKTWSSSKIVSELADAGFNVEIVTELPSVGDPHTIYFILKSDSSVGDVYDEWMYIDDNWEMVGNTQIDLSDYATLAYVDASLARKADVYEVATVAEIEALFAEPVPPTPSVPYDEIWYTTSDGEIIPIGGGSGSGSGSGSGNGSGDDSGWPEVLSNTYEDGKGVVKFAENLTEIPASAFWRCTSLTSIEIPNSVTSIEKLAFEYCSDLTSVTIGNGVESIGKGAFQGCGNLNTIIIPNNVTSIGENAFSSCIGLTSVTIPNGVTSIANYAFNGCNGLTSVTIGNGVTSIGAYAFQNCARLTSINYTGTVVQWHSITKSNSWHINVPATTVHCSDGNTYL